MTRQKQTLLGRMYDVVEIALWVSLAIGVTAFALVVAPGLRAAGARGEAERLAAVEHECEFYCTKWGFKQGTGGYSACVSDMHQFRDSVLKQLTVDFF